MCRGPRARKGMPSWASKPTGRLTLSRSGGSETSVASVESESHDQRVRRQPLAALVIGWARRNCRKTRGFVEGARRRIVDSNLEKQRPGPRRPHAVDNRGQQGPPGAATLAWRADRKGQEF